MKLAENIRSFRKDRGLTQEQLAEALGVTMGAVYKWENKLSTPEIRLIIEMADLFETSVDVLLGYELRNNDRESLVKRLQGYIRDKNAPEALLEAEKALKKYPNDFYIVYFSADLYEVRGTSVKNKAWIERAIELFTHACRLSGQNTSDKISLLSIQIKIAELHLILGEHEKGIDLLKRNNPCYLNNVKIGRELAVNGKDPDEALPYLSIALIDSVSRLVGVVNGYANLYARVEDYDSAIAILQWLLNLLPGLTYPGKTCFYEKVQATHYVACGEMYWNKGDRDGAKSSLVKARAIAVHFDSAPNYQGNSVRWTAQDYDATIYDDFGPTAMEAIKKQILEADGDIPGFQALWEEVCNEEA